MRKLIICAALICTLTISAMPYDQMHNTRFWSDWPLTYYFPRSQNVTIIPVHFYRLSLREKNIAKQLLKAIESGNKNLFHFLPEDSSEYRNVTRMKDPLSGCPLGPLAHGIGLWKLDTSGTAQLAYTSFVVNQFGHVIDANISLNKSHRFSEAELRAVLEVSIRHALNPGARDRNTQNQPGPAGVSVVMDSESVDPASIINSTPAVTVADLSSLYDTALDWYQSPGEELIVYGKTVVCFGALPMNANYGSAKVVYLPWLP